MWKILRSSWFWLPFLVTLCIAAACFAWEIGIFRDVLPSLPRPSPTSLDFLFAGTTTFLLALNVGLVLWRSHFGSCPRGVKRTTGIAGVLGIVSLFCPVCLALPVTLLGAGAFLTILAPFLPLLRLIVLVLLTGTLILLWPRNNA